METYSSGVLTTQNSLYDKPKRKCRIHRTVCARLPLCSEKSTSQDLCIVAVTSKHYNCSPQQPCPRVDRTVGFFSLLLCMRKTSLQLTVILPVKSACVNRALHCPTSFNYCSTTLQLTFRTT